MAVFLHHLGGFAPPRGDVVAIFPSVLALAVLSSAPRERPPAAAGRLAADQIDACRRGDRAALEAVFRAHSGTLARLLTRIVGPSAEIEDLLQDTFAAAITAFRTFRGEASVKTWLHRIAIHVAHQHLRRPRHRREVELLDPDAVVREPPASQTPEQRDLARRLYEHLDALDATKRIALVAEARIFLADVAQAAGALDRAVERYLAVATEFADLPAGESALYAVARIELRRSRTAAGRAVLVRYLARYPSGRYADDARRQLAGSP